MAETAVQSEITKEQDKPEKRKKKKRRIGRVVRICVVIVLLAAAGGLAYWYFTGAGANGAATGDVYMLQPVRVGTLSKTVYGSGMIQAASQPSVLAEASGTVVDLRVSVGDEIQAGQVLLVMENQDLDTEIRSLEYSLWEKDISITSSATGSEVTGVKAPVAGRVMQVNVSQGDDALAKYREHGSVVILSTDGRMKVDFDVLDNAALALGDDVLITGEGFEAAGTITELYMQRTKATATILSDELPMDAHVSILRSGEPIGEGTLEINKPLAVSAHGGTVEDVRVEVGDMVSQKMTLITLSDAPVSLELENLRMQRESIAESLEAAVRQRENLIVVAPSSGVISSINVDVGDSVQSGMVLMAFVKGEEMVLSIAVDELDVVEVAAGQPVQVYVDALPDLELKGSVEKIAPVGTGSGGVSSYDVSLNFSAEGTGVKPGMNASGEVEVASVENALYVPIEALMTVGNQQFVMVYEQTEAEGSADAASQTQTRDDGGSVGQGAPDGEGATDRRLPDGESSDQAPSDGGAMRQSPVEGAFTAPNMEGRQFTAPDTEEGEFTIPDMEERMARMSEAGGAATYAGASLGTASQPGTLRAVETGIGNDDYIQILSGLSVGEIVMYQNTGSSDTSNFGGAMVTQVMGGSGANLGGMGGMMPR